MNRKSLIQVVKVCLLASDGLTKREIKNLNPDFDLSCIKVGCNLALTLKEVKI